MSLKLQLFQFRKKEGHKSKILIHNTAQNFCPLCLHPVSVDNNWSPYYVAAFFPAAVKHNTFWQVMYLVFSDMASPPLLPFLTLLPLLFLSSRAFPFPSKQSWQNFSQHLSVFINAFQPKTSLLIKKFLLLEATSMLGP